MSRVAFDGSLLIEPQGRFAFRVGVPTKASPLNTGRVALIGEADGGSYAHSGAYKTTVVPWYSSAKEIRDEFKQGVGVRVSELLFAPSPTYPGGAKEVAFLRAQAATPATATVKGNNSGSNADALTLTSVSKGLQGNSLRVKAEIGTQPWKAVVPGVDATAKSAGHLNFVITDLSGSYVGSKFALKTSTSGASTVDDTYKGCEITIVSTSNTLFNGFKAVVTRYSGADKTFVLDRALPAVPTASDSIYISVSKEIVFVSSGGSSTTVVTSTSVIASAEIASSGYVWAPNGSGLGVTQFAESYLISGATGNYYPVKIVEVSSTTVTITISSSDSLALAAGDQVSGVTWTLRTGYGGAIAATNASQLQAIVVAGGTGSVVAPAVVGDATADEAVDWIALVKADGTGIEYKPIQTPSTGSSGLVTIVFSTTPAYTAAANVTRTNYKGWFLVRGKKITVHYDSDNDGIVGTQESYASYDNVSYPAELAKAVNEVSGNNISGTVTQGRYLFTTAVANGTATGTTGGYVNFSGGTAPAMTGTTIQDALDLIVAEDVNFVFICSTDAAHHALGLAHCMSAETPRIMFCGGPAGETTTQVKARAVALNSERAVLCWPGVLIPTEGSGVIATHSPMYFAALCCGLAAAVSPEIPLTRKAVICNGFEQLTEVMTRARREDLIKSGVLFGRYIEEQGYVINQGINTIQKNDQLWNYIERTSPEISLVRTRDQIGREFSKGAEKLGVGGNIQIITPAVVEGFSKRTLKGFVQRNLIITFSEPVILQEADYYDISFTWDGNNPINFMLSTGTVVS